MTLKAPQSPQLRERAPIASAKREGRVDSSTLEPLPFQPQVLEPFNLPALSIVEGMAERAATIARFKCKHAVMVSVGFEPHEAAIMLLELFRSQEAR